MTNPEMAQGFLDGHDMSSPEPSANRTHSYRHGFANGRDDRHNKPRAHTDELRRMAAEAIRADDATLSPTEGDGE
jgi:hypothetical protein